MIKIIKADPKGTEAFLKSLNERSANVNAAVSEVVSDILSEVKAYGDAALLRLSNLYDKKAPETLEVSRDEINDALTDADPSFIDALLSAQENITAYHNRQKRQSFIDAKENGVILGQRIRGLKRVGLYVPGGTAAYPSSVLMNAIPARIAGVEELIMVTPPSEDGKANPDILAAAALCGVDRIFLTGGAQAVAALAYGTDTIPKVDKIVGPGNIYVATAKKQLFGIVDIDMIAGPSEILILADETANPKYLAADLMSQAEHDVHAGAILLTTSEPLAQRVKEELERQLQALSRADIIKQSLQNYGGILVCDSVDVMLSLANEIAPEHLEIMLPNPMEYLGRLDNAGSIFMGEFSPEPLGDYYAGPNHVLPTGRTARFFSPLGVDSFVKKTSFTYYTRDALREAKEDIVTIAEKEGLTAHANSIKVRF